jgi:hypothetical protein
MMGPSAFITDLVGQSSVTVICVTRNRLTKNKVIYIWVYRSIRKGVNQITIIEREHSVF